MTQKPAAPTPRTPFAAKLVIGLSCLNLLALCLVNYLLYLVSETWWVGTVLTYSPRAPLLIPTLILLLASLIWHRYSLGMNLVSAGIVLVPIMGLSLPLDLWLNGAPVSEGEMVLKIVSCNVQSFQPNFGKIIAEIQAIKPDVVVLQEAFGDHDWLSDPQFRDWHSVHHGQYWVASRYRVSLLSDCEVTQFGGRLAGMLAQIETPAGPITLGNIHQMTARVGLKQLNLETLRNGRGAQELEDLVAERHLESNAIRVAVNSVRTSSPLIVCGDFNVPTSSKLFRKHWGDLKSSYDSAGLGYGYTIPCQGNRLWPDQTPWARIDHILCSQDWLVRACQVGTSNGSDHRLITATLVLKGETSH